ncbi:MAG: bifunctional proline dehydrogenase/L-glutamate gamma-semialdehyde dehydrogenase [Gammaproteobacteria bacterium HGW-Gammaproteobacteria-3]|nr:MAG: bifunctional proline dehydrogenase/L-glutamate gamma-semialdehyde dehydrogenase [Gammaproteobacteria bacterium HGW-Gammaproteobacteria-3]
MNLQALRTNINQAWLADEPTVVQDLPARLQDYRALDATTHAHALVAAVRDNKERQSVVEAFLHEYQLNSEEGRILMSIAEALLRIPDLATQDRFLADKLTAAHWPRHSDSLLMNLSTGALQLTGQFEQYLKAAEKPRQLFEKLLARLGQPLIRTALKQAMHLLGAQFVIAGTIEQAIAASREHSAYRYSFDMLGEAAVTATDADYYYQAYLHAIKALALTQKPGDIFQGAGISIKLSALSPRYEPLQHRRAVPELTEKLLYLTKYACSRGISVTLDAEESERLDMSLTVFESVFTHPDLCSYPGFGLALQAYQKRALPVIRWLAALARSQQKKIPVRLVKGAYWDSEIKRAQENGLSAYPVFTRKSATDISYLVCAQALLSDSEVFYPQFATHNAHTVAAIAQFGKQRHSNFEFQRLHGMGEPLYREFMTHSQECIACRVYAPVGSYQDLLPYLIRRLLENGANTSFINQVENPAIAIDQIVQDPVACWQQGQSGILPLPADLYGSQRVNSQGLNLADAEQLDWLQQQLDALKAINHQACPLIDGNTYAGAAQQIKAPADKLDVVGTVVFSDAKAVTAALDAAAGAFAEWRLHPVKQRAAYLRKAADLLELGRLELVSLCVREGGRTIKDALAEVREAVDFCRYYGACALDLFDAPVNLPGPTGETNCLRYYGRGVFVCISPWNFPIAIFIGQIAAALVSGNTVIAKPAELTSLTAMACIRILHQAGIPESVLHFLPGHGARIGPQLLADERVAGVAFTGSTATARFINQQLAELQAIVPLIAETGGQNVLIADSSAHKQQLVQDVIQSAFNSAGQRCSALRVLFLPLAAADQIIELLTGAMAELVLGNPCVYATDIGPVISADAADKLSRHVETLRGQCKMFYQMPTDKSLNGGSFFPPCLVEINDLSQLQEEVFGPVLHIIRYHPEALDQVVQAVNATGYGLTLGIHSRIDDTLHSIQLRARVGNVYINRNMIGAVVGVQPFGGMGLSGTGPKAGGPDYLRRFAVEQTVTTNTAAVGGNTGLLAQDLR